MYQTNNKNRWRKNVSSSRTNGSKSFFKGNKKLPRLHHSRLIKKASPLNEVVYESPRFFIEMNLHPALTGNILSKGYLKPTEIQDKTIDPVYNGQNLLGIAKTGTGKTGAFLIPIINRLMTSQHPFSTLVIAPTRELAGQIETEFKSLTPNLKLFSTCFTGGTSINRDIQTLKKRFHLIVGTPGRLIDLMNRGHFRPEQFKILVLDEFDRMLDMGFIDDVKMITSRMTRREQTLLFSATVDKSLKPLIDELLPVRVEILVSQGTVTNDHIEQDIVKVPSGQDKFEVLLQMINKDHFEKVLLFSETRRSVEKIHAKLSRHGVNSGLLHGQITQNERRKALEKFRHGKLKVLVATDVAARGLDINGITHVINYEIPLNYEQYIHRVGRTGRADKRGWAYTFVD